MHKLACIRALVFIGFVATTQIGNAMHYTCYVLQVYKNDEYRDEDRKQV